MTATDSTPMQDAAATSYPMRGPRRCLFLCALLVLFGPASVMAVASPLVLGPGISLLLGKLLGTIAPTNDVPWRHAIEPVFLPIASLAGLFALQEVARALLQGRERLAYSSTAIASMALAGVAAIVVVGLDVVPHQPTHPFAFLCVYFPLIGAAHIFGMSWRLLLPPSTASVKASC